MSHGRSIIAFLTGQSDPRSCALSPEQASFLAGQAGGTLPLNFPYDPSSPPHRPTPLTKASFHNSRQYLLSRRAAFAKRHRESFLDTFAGYSEVILLAGSCGLELLSNLNLPPAFLQRTHVFAYGPVSRSIPDCATLRLVQGRRDFISRRWHRTVDHLVDAGHMDYLTSPDLPALFDSFLQLVASRRPQQTHS